MRILHITETFAPAGGIETYVLDLLPLLQSHGHKNLVVYFREHPRTLSLVDTPTYHVPLAVGQKHDHAVIKDIIRREKPDVIYLHAVYDPTIVDQVRRLAPTIAYIHGFAPVCPGLAKYYRRGDQVCGRPFGPGCISMIYRKRCATARHPLSVCHIMRTTAKNLNVFKSLPGVIVASAYMKKLLLQNGFDGNAVKVLPYFVHIPDQSRVTEPNAHAPAVLFAGRLEVEKGLPYVLRVISSRESWQLLVAGEGSLMQTYILEADKLHIRGRVQFLGWLSADELQACYQRCSVVVMPTIMPEPFGKVGVEAMANARPVVAFDVGGIREWLKDGYNGFLVSPRDSKGLKVRLDKLMDDTGLATDLGVNGRRFVKENYPEERHVEHLVSILETRSLSRKVCS